MRTRDPVWDHVTVASAYGSSGTKRWTCNYCRVSYTGGPVRIRAHLLCLRGYEIGPCPQAPPGLSSRIARPGAIQREEIIPPTATAGEHYTLVT